MHTLILNILNIEVLQKIGWECVKQGIGNDTGWGWWKHLKKCCYSSP